MTTSDVRLQSVIYPESDAEPVGETDDHRDLMFELIFVLKNLLSQTVAYVAGNLFIYYEEGQPGSVVAPDVFVIFGVPQRNRRTYKIWEHSGKCPDLVIELTSSKTRYEDLGNKRVLYAELGVQEYYILIRLATTSTHGCAATSSSTASCCHYQGRASSAACSMSSCGR